MLKNRLLMKATSRSLAFFGVFRGGCLLRSRSAWAFCLIAFVCVRAHPQQIGLWGDQGDGSYRNPIIAADYSDPDVVRVGNDFYMVASTFESSPGIPILHSRDLVNWTTIGYAFAKTSTLGPDFNWDRMRRYGNGLFAPSLRYHAGKFWVFVNSYSGEGFLMSTATDPAGPWTVTQIKDRHGKPLRTARWTDPCPFWDDDGKAYLASSRPGSFWFGYLFRMTPDGTQLLDADVNAMNEDKVRYEWPNGGTLFSPFQGTEGNKLFKRDGYYYLQHIEFRNDGHGFGTYIMRSKNIYGTKDDGSPGKPGDPGNYDILKFGDDIPGQGGFFDTPDGRWFWIGQYKQGASDGRMPNLLPVTWIDDWPVPGVNITDKKGSMAWQLPKPTEGQPIVLPQGSDAFDETKLQLQWEWNHQPRAEMWSLTERPGYLRLHAFQPTRDDFFGAGNTINQRHMRSVSSVVTIKIDVTGFADGQEGGLSHFNGGTSFATFGVLQTRGKRSLKYEEKGLPSELEALPEGTHVLWLRSTTGFDDLNQYSFSLDGATFKKLGGLYKLTYAGYRGDMVGIYTYNSLEVAGYLDVDSFESESINRPPR